MVPIFKVYDTKSFLVLAFIFYFKIFTDMEKLAFSFLCYYGYSYYFDSKSSLYVPENKTGSGKVFKVPVILFITDV